MFNLVLYGHTIWIATCSSERKIKIGSNLTGGFVQIKSITNLMAKLHLDEWTDINRSFTLEPYTQFYDNLWVLSKEKSRTRFDSRKKNLLKRSISRNVRSVIVNTLTFVFLDALSRDPVGGSADSSFISHSKSPGPDVSESPRRSIVLGPFRVALSNPFPPPSSFLSYLSPVRHTASILLFLDLSFRTRSPLVQR